VNVQIEVKGRNIPFGLDWEKWRWESSEKQPEANFPLITFVDGKRYELYSDETFAEAEK
jgi:hypothetical protein